MTRYIVILYIAPSHRLLGFLKVAIESTLSWRNSTTPQFQGSHRFCLAKFQNFSKTFPKPTPNPGLTSLGKTNPKTPMASLQGRTCTVQCVPFDSGFQEVQNFSKPNLQIPYISRAWN